MRRFFDSEHKIFAQNDKDIHALYTKYGKEYDIKSLSIEATRKNSNNFVVDNKEFLETLK